MEYGTGAVIMNLSLIHIFPWIFIARYYRDKEYYSDHITILDHMCEVCEVIHKEQVDLWKLHTDNVAAHGLI